MRPFIVDWLARHSAGLIPPLVPSTAVAYAAAIVVFFLLFLRRCRQAGLSPDLALGGALSAFVGGIVGARVFYLIVSGSLARLGPREWLSVAGTASWGAYLGSSLGLLGFLRMRRTPILPYFDVAASGVCLAIALGRIGCFLNGDDFGRITDLPWAVRYPPGSYPYLAHLSRGLIDSVAAASLPTHPLQLYLSLAALLLFWVLSRIWRAYSHAPGVTLAAFLIVDGASRFWIEFLRDPAAGGGANGLSVSQRMCVISLALGALLMVWRRRQQWRNCGAPHRLGPSTTELTP
jgi:phosphatidylglycerol:prolipoprotein diacylglycerol transferase